MVSPTLSLVTALLAVNSLPCCVLASKIYCEVKCHISLKVVILYRVLLSAMYLRYGFKGALGSWPNPRKERLSFEINYVLYLKVAFAIANTLSQERVSVRCFCKHF